MTIAKATPMDAGCYVSSQHGRYSTALMINVAATVFSYQNEAAQDLAERHLATMGSFDPDAEELTAEEYWTLNDAASDAEQWLNDNVAPDDYWFGWHEGEFFLQSVDWWNEDSGL